MDCATMEFNSIAERLSRASPRLLVLGDVILDQFVYGQVQRISPEAPVPVVNVTHERFFAGGAANVMLNLVSLGADVQGLAVVGPDTDCARLQEQLTAGGVPSNHFVMQAD